MARRSRSTSAPGGHGLRGAAGAAANARSPRWGAVLRCLGRHDRHGQGSRRRSIPTTRHLVDLRAGAGAAGGGVVSARGEAGSDDDVAPPLVCPLLLLRPSSCSGWRPPRPRRRRCPPSRDARQLAQRRHRRGGSPWRACGALRDRLPRAARRLGRRWPTPRRPCARPSCCPRTGASTRTAAWTGRAWPRAWASMWNTRTRGASTPTMQLAGLLDEDLRSRARTQLRPEGGAGGQRRLARTWLEQGPDPRGVPEPRAVPGRAGGAFGDVPDAVRQGAERPERARGGAGRGTGAQPNAAPGRCRRGRAASCAR